MSFKLRYLYRSFLRTHLQSKSMLAMLCLGIGIATLIQVLALEAGMRAQMLALLADSGSRTLTILAGTVTALPNRGSRSSMARTLSLQDYAYIEAAALPLTRMSPLSSDNRSVQFRELATRVDVSGIYPAYFHLRHYQLAQGRLLDASDERTHARVAVLGAQTAASLFGNNQEQVLTAEQIPGQGILIGNAPFIVVGVLQARGGGQAGISEDDAVYIPLGTAMRRTFNVNFLNSIILEVSSTDTLAQLRGQVSALLRQSHQLGADEASDFTVLEASRALAAVARNQQFASGFFRTVALLTLGMAALGIFAVNHLNVRERASEFGLSKAVGARTISILALVLLETLLLGLAGGLGGIALGLLLMTVFRILTGWTLLVNVVLVLKALLAAVLLSVLAAVVPALMAANKDPLQALKRI